MFTPLPGVATDLPIALAVTRANVAANGLNIAFRPGRDWDDLSLYRVATASMAFQVVPSCNPTWQWKIPYRWRFEQENHLYFYGPCSSTPCLMTPEGRQIVRQLQLWRLGTPLRPLAGRWLRWRPRRLRPTFALELLMAKVHRNILKCEWYLLSIYRENSFNSEACAHVCAHIITYYKYTDIDIDICISIFYIDYSEYWYYCNMK